MKKSLNRLIPLVLSLVLAGCSSASSAASDQSSGISGTYNAARIAAEELMELYEGRFVHIVDSLGCGFGNGARCMRGLGREGQ